LGETGKTRGVTERKKPSLAGTTCSRSGFRFKVTFPPPKKLETRDAVYSTIKDRENSVKLIFVIFLVQYAINIS
jgi:hypothetical protein